MAGCSRQALCRAEGFTACSPEALSETVLLPALRIPQDKAPHNKTCQLLPAHLRQTPARSLSQGDPTATGLCAWPGVFAVGKGMQGVDLTLDPPGRAEQGLLPPSHCSPNELRSYPGTHSLRHDCAHSEGGGGSPHCAVCPCTGQEGNSAIPAAPGCWKRGVGQAGLGWQAFVEPHREIRDCQSPSVAAPRPGIPRTLANHIPPQCLCWCRCLGSPSLPPP